MRNQASDVGQQADHLQQMVLAAPRFHVVGDARLIEQAQPRQIALGGVNLGDAGGDLDQPA